MQVPAGAYFTLDTPPATPLLTTAEAKEHLRVDGADEDALIDAYVQAATDMIDAEYGELGRALITQTWRMNFAELPSAGFSLRFPPVQSITSITYYDTDDVQQTLSPALYRLISMSDYAYIYRPVGADWPDVFDRPDAIEVTYVAGYGAASAVPAGIRQAVRLMLGAWESCREAVTEKNMNVLPLGIRSILTKYRITSGHI